MIRGVRGRPVGWAGHASSAVEPAGLDPAWIVEHHDESISKQGGALLVTWDGQTNAPLIRPGDGKTLTWLHFLVVDRVIGLGFVVAGWFSDPLGQVAGIFANSAGEEDFDLFAEAACLTDPREMLGFGLPRDVKIKFGFVLLVPERFLGTTGELQLVLRLVSGEKRAYGIPPVGDAARLDDILVAASDDFVFGLVGHLLKEWRGSNPSAQRLPERLEALAGRVHKRIDPQRDYGVQAGRSVATCHVDSAIRVGTSGILAAGWLVPDPAAEIQEIALVSLFDRRVVMRTPLPSKARPDVAASGISDFVRVDCGYAVFAPIEGLDRLDAWWFLEVITESGGIRRTPFLCPPESPAFQGIEASVMLAEVNDPSLADLFERAVSPAVEWFWARTRRSPLVSTEMVYGQPPDCPRVSIIVPVYGRIDFVRHQIARFSNDPEFRGAPSMVDLIYVLDDPPKAEAFNRLCRFLFDVYGVPFRTLVQNQNRGYSAANNAGAAIARGSLLLLLNSDVFPVGPRWVSRLAGQYETLERCGVLGCRLLYDEGSIQHAGMNFRPSVMVEGCWGNDHPGKGLSVSFDTHTEAAPVPAVTGACLMIGRKVFDKIGGMSEEYVIGDFEDSDLCLRVQEEGLLVYYTPEVELYHLERQSMQFIGGGHVGWRQSLALYNMWKHSRRWGAFISRVLEGFELTSRVADRSVHSANEDGLPEISVPDRVKTHNLVPDSTLANPKRLPTIRAKRKVGRGKA